MAIRYREFATIALPVPSFLPSVPLTLNLPHTRSFTCLRPSPSPRSTSPRLGSRFSRMACTDTSQLPPPAASRQHRSRGERERERDRAEKLRGAGPQGGNIIPPSPAV